MPQMELYSQRDPSYKNKLLPKSNLTMGNYGCYVTSIAILGQVHPVSLLKDKNFAQGGLLYSQYAAEDAGMTYKGAFRSPKGWCIGVTDHYKSQGFPTHFFVVNSELQLQVDPLKENPIIEPLTYSCMQYRLFDGVKFSQNGAVSDENIQKAIQLNSECWHVLEDVKNKLHEANNLLRSQNNHE